MADVIKSSAGPHFCPLCASAHMEWRELSTHLMDDHATTMCEAGRWVHCTSCRGNFGSDFAWETHLMKTHCPPNAVVIQWKGRADEMEEGTTRGETGFTLESALTPFNGDDASSSRKRKFASRSKEGETPEQARERKQRTLMLNKQFMIPRAGWVIVRQRENFRCSICMEPSFPTIPSLVWHQRTVHQKQLADVHHWIHCTACNQDFGSLSGCRDHQKAAAMAAAAGGAAPPCTFASALISWQAELDSEEAKRFRQGLEPIAGGASVKKEAEAAEDGMLSDAEKRRRRRNQRVDKSFMVPRAGFRLVQEQANIVCQMCGESGYSTCYSLDHHMRKVHQASIHQAGMWMRCLRCSQDFTNLSSMRGHVRAASSGVTDLPMMMLATHGGAGLPTCSWDDIVMCWQEPIEGSGEGGQERRVEKVVKEEPEGSSGQRGRTMTEPTIDRIISKLVPAATAAAAAEAEEPPLFSLEHLLSGEARVKEEIMDEEEEERNGETAVDDNREKSRMTQFGLFDPTKFTAGSQFELRKETAMRCWKCEELTVFDNVSQLEDHLEKEHGEEVQKAHQQPQRWLECAACGVGFTAAAELLLHQHQLRDTMCAASCVKLCWMEMLKKGRE